MQLRMARRGRNAGKQFWSCTGYATKQCDGTLSFGVDSHSFASSESQVEPARTGTLEQPRVIVGRPFHDGLDTVYFEMLTVAAERLEDIGDRYVAGCPTVGAQWRLSYRRPPSVALSAELTRVMSVVDKLICKGHVTLLDPQLESALNRPSSAPAPTKLGALGPELDSDEERVVWSSLFPSMMGADYSQWCTPQVEVATLTGSGDFAGSEQRVDFLVAHPELARPIIVEIDGLQHATDVGKDSVRDRYLSASGYQVIRVPAAEVRTGDGPTLAMLRALLSSVAPASDFASDLSAPIRRAGQIQAALLHACFVGLVDVAQGFSVWTDLVEAGELTADEFAAVIEDFGELVRRVGALYGVDVAASGITSAVDESKCDVALCFRRSCRADQVVLFEEAYLPVSVKWSPRPVQPAKPVSFDPDLLRYFLTRIFRKKDFWDGQYDIIVRALQAKDTIALLRTGAGKSIAFQLAGMLLPGRTIVVAPITSLIRDQVYNLGLHGIGRALGISSDLSGRDERDVAYEMLKNGEAFFYYIAPERFQIEAFREKLRGMTAAFPVNLVVIDEAHCVSEWGHDFRTAYLRIGQTSRECSKSSGWTPALIALTGTASRAVLRDLQHELQITDFDAIVTPTTFDRGELRYEVLHERSEHKAFVLESFLANVLPSKFGLPAESFFRGDGHRTHCGLIFCPNVNGDYGVVEVAGLLTGREFSAAFYSGTKPKGFYGSEDDWKSYKRDAERRFKRDELPILVATKAFGMGIDKTNIRYTIHYGVPASIEAFYQEAGRAGRDGDPAVCAVIVSDDRADENRRVLAPATTIQEVASYVSAIPYSQNDDVTRALFFHVQAFKGVEAELAAVGEMLGMLEPDGTRSVEQVAFGQDSKTTEKALHRLVVIGVVRDYTVDYSARSFTVLLADATRESVIDKYCEYVAGYQPRRAAEERTKAEALAPNWDEFVLGVVGLYVQFVYDVIERGQRTAIANMLAATQSGSGDELRVKILAHLEQAEFSEAVEAVLSDGQAGLGAVWNVLSELVSPNDAARLRGSIARSLETYPDHPGLLLLRAATEALSRDGDDQTIVDNFEAFLMNASRAYGLTDQEMAGGTGSVLKVVARKNMGASQLIEQSFVGRISDRDALRTLIASAGMAAVQVAPWILLDQATTTVESKLA